MTCVTHHMCDCTAERLRELEAKLDAALAELRQCYRDDGCTEQEVEDQVSRFSL